MWRCALANAVLGLLFVAACSQGRSPIDASAPIDRNKPAPVAVSGGFDLPAPRDLLKPNPVLRGVSFSEYELMRNGSAYETGLPSSRVSINVPLADFAPQYSSSHTGLEPAAYAIYGFNLAGYTRDNTLRFTWETAPEPDTLYLGLANFISNRWDFRKYIGPQETVDSFQPYTAVDGSMYVALISLGAEPFSLRELRIGEAPQPEDLEPGTWAHTVGKSDDDYFRAVAVDYAGNIYAAGYSYDVWCGVSKWRPDGRLVWFNALSSVESATSPVWLACNVEDIAIDSQDNLVMVGYDASPTSSRSGEGIIVKLRPDGKAIWRKRLPYSGTLALDGPGCKSVLTDGTDIYIRGADWSGWPGGGYLMKLNEDGQVDWCRTYTVDVEGVSGGCNECALLRGPGGAQGLCIVEDASLVCVDLNGNLLSAATPEVGTDEVFGKCFTVNYDPVAETTTIYFLCDINHSWQDPGVYPRGNYLMGLTPQLEPVFSRRLDSLDVSLPVLSCIDGKLIVVGGYHEDAVQGGALWTLSTADGSILDGRIWQVASGYADHAAAAACPQGVVMVGRAMNSSGDWAVQDMLDAAESVPWKAVDVEVQTQVAQTESFDGEFYDVQDLMTLDTGGGAQDSLLSFVEQ